MIKYFLIGAAFCFINCLGGERKTEQRNEIKEPAKQEPAKTTAVENERPQLLITFEDGTKKSAHDLTGKTVLVLFQPDCDHCQREAADFERHISSFNDFQLYFVSSATIQEVLKFANDYKLKPYKNIHWGTTTVTNILSSLGPIEAPSVYLYDESGQLISNFNGEVAVETMIKYIQ